MYKGGIIMALIQCPECRKNVSETAETCPNCGFAIKNHVLKQKIADQRKKEQEARKVYDSKKAKLTQEYAQYSFEPPTLTKSIIFIGMSIFFSIMTILFLLIIFEVVGDGSHPVGWAIFTLLFAILTGLAGSNYFTTEMKEYRLYKNDPESYKANHSKRIPLTPEQNKEIEKKLLTEYDQLQYESLLLDSLKIELNPPTPTVNVRPEAKSNVQRCPHCNSTRIRHISTANRMVSVAAVGLASGKIGKQFECLNCTYKW